MQGAEFRLWREDNYFTKFQGLPAERTRHRAKTWSLSVSALFDSQGQRVKIAAGAASRSGKCEGLAGIPKADSLDVVTG